MIQHYQLTNLFLKVDKVLPTVLFINSMLWYGSTLCPEILILRLTTFSKVKLECRNFIHLVEEKGATALPAEVLLDFVQQSITYCALFSCKSKKLKLGYGRTLCPEILMPRCKV